MPTARQEKIQNKAILFPIKLSEDRNSAIPDVIQVIPTGQWDHPSYGEIRITADDITEFKRNFDNGVRKGVPITAGHEGMIEQPAVGWFTELYDRGEKGLYAKVEWNDEGQKLLQSKAFKFFSPEFFREYEDPQTQERYSNVLSGGALTKSPYFKELDAVVFSDQGIINQLTFNENMPEEIKNILEKDAAELSDEERTMLRDNADQLSDEQKEAFASVFEEEDAEEAEEAAADEEATEEVEEPTEEPAEEAPKPDAEPQEHSDHMVQIQASELKALQTKANEGQQAYRELQESRKNSAIDKVVFSSNNPNGRFLPKDRNEVEKFMDTLSSEQYSDFVELVQSIPAKLNFNEIGDNGSTTKNAQNVLDKKIEAKMSENEGLKYSDAMKQVFSENPELAKEYDAEISA